MFVPLPSRPIFPVPLVVKLPESLGALRESSGRQRDRIFSYARFLELLGAGME